MQTLQSQIAWCARGQKALAAVACIAIATFYAFAYRPDIALLKRLTTAIAAHQSELRTNQAKAASRNLIAAHNERLRQELDRIKKPSKQAELPDLIKELTLFGQQCLLRKFYFFVAGLPTRSELFSEQPLALRFDGDFQNVFSFLRSIEEVQRLIRVRSMTLKTKDNHDGQVSVEMAINIYFSAE